eukprot:6799822-Prymnesium_polylepis.1
MCVVSTEGQRRPTGFEHHQRFEHISRAASHLSQQTIEREAAASEESGHARRGKVQCSTSPSLRNGCGVARSRCSVAKSARSQLWTSSRHRHAHAMLRPRTSL